MDGGKLWPRSHGPFGEGATRRRFVMIELPIHKASDTKVVQDRRFHGNIFPRHTLFSQHTVAPVRQAPLLTGARCNRAKAFGRCDGSLNRRHSNQTEQEEKTNSTNSSRAADYFSPLLRQIGCEPSIIAFRNCSVNTSYRVASQAIPCVRRFHWVKTALCVS